MPKGGAPCTGVTDEEIVMETVVRVDDSEEEPGMGWECDTDSVDVDKHHEWSWGNVIPLLRCTSVMLIEKPSLQKLSHASPQTSKPYRGFFNFYMTISTMKYNKVTQIFETSVAF